MGRKDDPYGLKTLPSAEIEEIMGQVPPRILRFGIMVVALVLTVLLFFAWLIRYPDKVRGEVEIITERPYVPVVSKLDERIQHIFVSDSARVARGDVLAVLGGGVSREDLEVWKDFILRLQHLIQTDSLWLLYHLEEPAGLDLSVVGTAAGKVSAHWSAYRNLLRKETQFDQARAESLHRRIREQDQLIRSLSRRIQLLQEAGRLVRQDFRRDSLLAASGGISASELEHSRRLVIQHQIDLEEARTRQAEVIIKKGEYEQNLLEFLSDNQVDADQALADLDEAIGEALHAIDEWEDTHVLLSPLDGRVSMTRFWSEGQAVKQHDIVMHIVPEETGNLIGKLRIPLRGSGLVAAGAEVRIQPEGFPAMEYGVVEGRIMKISAIPDEDMLLADVSLPDGLRTSYGETLPFQGSLRGQAEVVTRQARLLERLVRPLRYLSGQNEIKK